MSSNYLSYYSSYYGYPSNYYSKNCYTSCKCACKTKCCNPCYPACNPCPQPCNPCQPVYNYCQPCPAPCPAPCPTPCPAPCPPCPPRCPDITYVTGPSTTGIVIPTGGTPIPVGSTIVPAGSVTVITTFAAAPTTNVGGIAVNNGQFIIPIAGRYDISGTVCLDVPANSVIPAGSTFTLYIYKVDVTTGVITLLAANTAPFTGAGTTPTVITTSCSNAATTADLAAGDRVFFAVTQNTGLATVTTSTTAGRFAITRLCNF